MTNRFNKVKTHAHRATNMSFSDIVKGSGRLVGNTIGLSLRAVGATIYVADKAVSAGLQVGKAAYDETRKGYHQTDDILSSNPEPQPAKREPQQMDMFDQMWVKMATHLKEKNGTNVVP